MINSKNFFFYFQKLTNNENFVINSYKQRLIEYESQNINGELTINELLKILTDAGLKAFSLRIKDKEEGSNHFLVIDCS
jgi:hypothetical protein